LSLDVLLSLGPAFWWPGVGTDPTRNRPWTTLCSTHAPARPHPA